MKVVTADSSPDGMAASSSQRSRRGQSIVVCGRDRRRGRASGRRRAASAGRAPEQRQDAHRGDRQQDDEHGVPDRPDAALVVRPRRGSMTSG